MKKIIIICGLLISLIGNTHAQVDSTYYFASWFYHTPNGVSVDNTILALDKERSNMDIIDIIVNSNKDLFYSIEIKEVSKATYDAYHGDISNIPAAVASKLYVKYVILSSSSVLQGQSYSTINLTIDLIPIKGIESALKEDYKVKIVSFDFIE